LDSINQQKLNNMTKLVVNTASLWTIEQEDSVFSLYSFSVKIGTYKTYAQALEVLFEALERANVPMEFTCLNSYYKHGK